jgi:integration host factor subunit alpha
MKMLSRDNTHKRNISVNIHNNTGIPLTYAAELIDDMINIIISSVKKNKNIKIKNFGSFSLVKKNKRIGRNPKNKIKYDILERNILSFKAANKLKEKINIYAGL